MGKKKLNFFFPVWTSNMFIMWKEKREWRERTGQN